MSNSEPTAANRTPRGIVALMMAIIAAAFVFLFLLEERPADPGAVEGLTGFVTTKLISQAIGGAISGWLLAGLFGRSGVLGWVLAVLGGIVATLIAGALGGLVLSLPDIITQGFQAQEAINVALGAFIVPLAAAGKPMVAAAWAALILLTHVLALRERAS